jgi:AcrR family transcriptional regulator
MLRSRPVPAASATLEPDRLRQLRDRLRDRDWREVTTEELANAAGVSRMTLHRRGIAKDAILAQLGALLEVEHREAAFPALVSTEPARVRLRMALEAMCDVSERYLGVLDALDRAMAALFHEPGEGAVLTRATLTDALRRIIEDGIEDGTLRAKDPEETATLLFNAVGWTYRHMRTGHRWPPERARDRVVDLLVDGLAR